MNRCTVQPTCSHDFVTLTAICFLARQLPMIVCFAYFPKYCSGLFTSLLLYSICLKKVMQTHCWPFILPVLGMIRDTFTSRTEQKTKLTDLSKLTNDHGISSVPLGVLFALANAAGAGLGLVGAQRLPLALQTVLVLQVVLHVRLQGERRDHFKQEARAKRKNNHFLPAVSSDCLLYINQNSKNSN